MHIKSEECWQGKCRDCSYEDCVCECHVPVIEDYGPEYDGDGEDD